MHKARPLSASGTELSTHRDVSYPALFRALTGKPLWEFETGSSVHANPISFPLDWHQFIAIADRVLYVFSPSWHSPVSLPVCHNELFRTNKLRGLLPDTT